MFHNKNVRNKMTQNTLGALQAVAGYLEMRCKSLKDSHRALDGMDQEQRLFLILN